MRGTIILAILAAALASSADAARRKTPAPIPLPPSVIEPADAVLAVMASADGTSLTVRGWLDVGSFIKFRRVLAANPGVKTVRLASAGGLIQEGALIASTIRDARLDTRVETICASACTLALAAGVERSATPDAWIGFHRARWVPREGDTDGPITEPDPDVLQRGLLRRAGIDPAFIGIALRTAPDGIWFPNRQTLIDAKVLTSPEDAPTSDDIAAAKAQTAALMRVSPLWAAVEHRAPDEFARAFGLVWRLRTTGLDDGAIMAEAQSGLIRGMLTRIATSPEPLATAFLASMAKSDPGACATTGWGARLPSPAQQAEQADLLLRIVSGEQAGAAMDIKEARHSIRKPLGRTMRAFPAVRRTSEADLRCRAGLDLVQQITAMSGEKRAKAFQAYAMLQTGGELPAFAIPA